MAGIVSARVEPYHGLMAECYDSIYDGLTQLDLEFYQEKIRESGGPALELGVGSGRLLLPYLEAGLEVEGVDPSGEMLAICRRKADQRGLSPRLYEQSAQELALPGRYRVILMAAGSFQLIAVHREAREALRRSYAHLAPGGRFLLTTSIPWSLLGGKGRDIWYSGWPRIEAPEGKTICCHSAYDSLDLVEQTYVNRWRFEVYREGKLEETQIHTTTLRWYGKDEMWSMLEAAGFQDISVKADFEGRELLPQSSLEGDAMMVWEGINKT